MRGHPSWLSPTATYSGQCPGAGKFRQLPLAKRSSGSYSGDMPPLLECPESHRTICGVPARSFAGPRAGSWSRFKCYSGTLQFKRRNDTSGRSRTWFTRQTTASSSGSQCRPTFVGIPDEKPTYCCRILDSRQIHFLSTDQVRVYCGALHPHWRNTVAVARGRARRRLADYVGVTLSGYVKRARLTDQACAFPGAGASPTSPFFGGSAGGGINCNHFSPDGVCNFTPSFRNCSTSSSFSEVKMIV
jgi:hypothetical protein